MHGWNDFMMQGTYRPNGTEDIERYYDFRDSFAGHNPTGFVVPDGPVGPIPA